MSSTPSVTPKPERRRNRIIRQSISQPPPFSQSYHGEGNGKAEDGSQRQKREEQRRSLAANLDLAPENGDGTEGEGHSSSAPALYHQICLQPAEMVANLPAKPFDWAQHSSLGHEQLPFGVPGTGNVHLLHKVQMLHGLEVLCRRLLFHLVKTAAGAPKFFLLLPFLLLALTLLLCSSSWPSGPLRFLYPFDSLQFGPDPNGGCFLGHRMDQRSQQQQHFQEDNPAFDALRRSSPADFGILLSTIDPMDSVLSPNGTALDFAELFHQIQDMTVQHQKQSYKWWDLCRICGMDPVVEHLLANSLDWHFPEAIHIMEAKKGNGNETGTGTMMEKPPLFLAGTIGDVELNSSDGTLRRAHTLLMRLKLKAQLRPALVDAFERRLRRIVTNFSRAHGQQQQPEEAGRPLLVHFWSSQRFSDEMELALKGSHWRMSFSWLLLLAILCLAQCRASSYESRPFLGLSQAFAILLSAVCAYSVHVASAGHLNPLLLGLPYILAAIGVLIFASVDSAFQRYSGISMHPTEKMAFLFIWDGPSVVLGLLWLVLLSLISAFLLQPSFFLLQFFLALSAGLCSLLLCTLTFLLVCWLNTARRIASGLRWYQIMRSGDQAFNEKQIFDYDAHTCARLHEKLADLRPCFARSLGHFVCGVNFRMLAFALFCVGCIGCGIAGLANARVSLEAWQFVTPSGQSRAFLNRLRESFPKYEDYLELNFEGPIDYLERREQIFSLLNWPVEAQFASRSTSWLLEFDKFQKSVSYQVNEESTLPLLTHVFLQSSQFRKFSADLQISQGQIHRSRMYLELTAKGREQSDFLVRSLLERARRLGLPLFLEVPFSFSIGHDIQVLPRLLPALFSLSTLSALLAIFQPALALCLFASNLFLSASVQALCFLLSVPLNVLTLGTFLLFGIPLNSLCVLLFTHNFFNAGPRQLSNQARLQYAFQCTLWPAFLACSIGPVSFSAQFLLGQCPPIVLAIWKVLALASLLIFAQMVVFLPSLLALASDLFHNVFTFAAQMCDENANAEMTVDPLAENVYFVPSFEKRRHGNNISDGSINWPNGTALGYSHFAYPLECFSLQQQHGSPLCVLPAYQPPPIDFPRKSPMAQHRHLIHHSRQQSQLSNSQQGNSPRLGGSSSAEQQQQNRQQQRSVPMPPMPIYSPPNKRRGENYGGGSKTDSSQNSFSESLESKSDLRVHQMKRSQANAPNAAFANHFRSTPMASVKCANNQQQQNKPVGSRIGTNRSILNDEQIYEEPDTTPEICRREEPVPAGLYRKSTDSAPSPSYRRKFQI